ncbi:MAG: HD-GYP domain-containing protein [Saccharofermentanales bacterium]
MKNHDRPSAIKYKDIFITVLINIVIIVFITALVSMQYFSGMTLLESKLLNFLFIIPVFISVYKHNLYYGTVIIVVAIACNFIFPFSGWEISYSMVTLSILAAQLVMFILSAVFVNHIKDTINDLKSEIKEKDERLIIKDDRNYNDIMEILVKVIDAKDSYTYQHSKRVAYYAKNLAVSFGLSEEAAERVYIAGILHDVGKIGLNENILNKKTKLDENEKLEAIRHPTIGARIAENLNCFKDVIPGIYYHHEVYNGSGYPEGLKGDKIPLAARILSIADAFDAMTSDRSYRSKMTVDNAVKRLIENIGIQFDPHLIVTFIDLINNNAIHVDADKVYGYNDRENLKKKRLEL